MGGCHGECSSKEGAADVEEVSPGSEGQELNFPAPTPKRKSNALNFTVSTTSKLSPSIPTPSTSSNAGVQRVHGLGQLNADLTGTYKPIRDFVKGFTPTKRVSEYVMDAGEHVLPQKALTYLPDVLREVGLITQSLLENPKVKAILDAHNVQPMELFAMVLYSFDLALIWPNGWDGDKKDNWYYAQNMLLQERNVAKIDHMLGFLFFFMGGLQKLPDWQGELFRGIDETGAQIIQEHYHEGRRVHFSGSSSATPHVDVSRQFAGDRGVVLRMRVRTGRDIALISAIPGEQEVLLFPNTAFIVTRAFHFDSSLGCNAVDLLETAAEATHVF